MVRPGAPESAFLAILFERSREPFGFKSVPFGYSRFVQQYLVIFVNILIEHNNSGAWHKLKTKGNTSGQKTIDNLEG